MGNPDSDFAAFKQCVKIQANLDLEVWDVILFQPLKDLVDWWNRQSEKTKQFTTFLGGGIGGLAFARWIGRVGNIASTEVAGLFAEALVAVIAGLTLGTFLETAGRCLIQIASA